MNWTCLRPFPWLDTRAQFVAQSPPSGTLLDLGSSDGETLGHIVELRPDLKLFAADKWGVPEKYPAPCEFRRADFEREALPWPDRSMDVITCMHLVEHLHGLDLLLREIARVLKPGGSVYFETPHPKSLTLPSRRDQAAGDFTFNFYDDPTHVRLVPIDALAREVRRAGLRVGATGTSRNWLFAAAHLAFVFLPPSRKKFTAHVHWLGWSAYLIADRPR
jgi:SAM-dependent methyltransferase